MNPEATQPKSTATEPRAFSIANHQSNALKALTVPELAAAPVRPAFPTKAAMLAWAHDDATAHHFYNFAEPTDPLRRCTKENPVKFLHGVVADFDTVIDRAMLLKGLSKVPADFPAAYASETFSKGARVVWLFEKPVPVFSHDLAKRFLTRVAKELKLSKILPGFDAGAFVDPARYFELGTDWLAVNPGARISSAACAHWVFEASSGEKFSDAGPEIPLADVAAEVERRWPGRWQGPFVVGAQGVRFWDDTARNPKGAWIRATGVQAFSGEGRFMHWGEVLGQSFVASHEREKIGGAIKGVYFSKRYWSKDAEGCWCDLGVDEFRRRLRARGLSQVSRRGEMSEVDRALNVVEEEHRVDGLAPFLYSDREVVFWNNQRLLNNARVKPLLPDASRHAWGDGFPWIARFLETMLGEDEGRIQLDVLLSWMASFYRGALEQKPRLGQALTLAGPAGCGKTFFATKLLPSLAGGFEHAEKYLMGETQFNDRLFHAPVWVVDDANATEDTRTRAKWTQNLKGMVAKGTHDYRAMYQSNVTMEFKGRIVACMNDDPDSIATLPSLEYSASDKMIFLLAKDTKGTVDFADVNETLANELPAFAAFLRDYAIPARVKGGGGRYEVESYKHPFLLEKAEEMSPAADFLDVLERWRIHYFRGVVGTEKSEWLGSAYDLQAAFRADDIVRESEFARSKSTVVIGRHLNKALSEGRTPWLTKATKHKKKGARYQIARPTRDELAEMESGEAVATCRINPSAAA